MTRRSAVLTAALIFVAMAPVRMASADYLITVRGNCPGTLTLNWAGAPVNKMQKLYFSMSTGSSTVPAGFCFGTPLGLASPVFVIAFNTGTGQGSKLFANVPPVACGGHVQMVEKQNCTTSNVAQIP